MTTNPARRALDIGMFLHHHGWDEADVQPLAADFSPRRYARLIKPDGALAILMDADDNQHTAEFVELAVLLPRCGVRAPDIYAAHAAQGLVLMEDLGGKTFGTLMDEGADAAPLYSRAVDILVTLHKNFVPDILNEVSDETLCSENIGIPLPLKGGGTPPVSTKILSHDDQGLSSHSTLSLPLFNSERFTAQAELYLDKYVNALRDDTVEDDERAMFRAAWHSALRGAAALPQTLLLRDYMPDNIIQAETGRDAVLDFQDAGIGPIAYDLASLCEVVRRDGGDAHLPRVAEEYWAKATPACTYDDLLRGITVLSAQRHMRILGILAKQLKGGRVAFRDYLPRVRTRLETLLRDDALQPVRVWIEKAGC